MYMYRKISEYLERWKSEKYRKPLIIQGARQVHVHPVARDPFPGAVHLVEEGIADPGLEIRVDLIAHSERAGITLESPEIVIRTDFPFGEDMEPLGQFPVDLDAETAADVVSDVHRLLLRP